VRSCPTSCGRGSPRTWYDSLTDTVAHQLIPMTGLPGPAG
jgi:hypothetical protein